MDRKEFFSKALIGGGLLFLAPALLNSCSKSSDPAPTDTTGGTNTGGTTTVDLTSNDFSALKTVGGFAYSGSIIIIRTGTSSYIALSSICTHQSCTVAYSSSDDKIKCPCHGSMFSTGGSVLQGPAASSLKSYNVTLSGTTLKIS
jgi:cytochrome b6-f complex iron-sulfur subunit